MAQARRRGMNMPQVGEWAFVLGVLIAVVLGVFPASALGLTSATTTAVLVVLGVIVGLLNIAVRETHNYLLAALAIVIAGQVGFSAVPLVGDFVATVLSNLAFLVAPAAIVVALKEVFSVARR